MGKRAALRRLVLLGCIAVLTPVACTARAPEVVAQAPPALQLEPGSGQPGTLVLVRSDSCPPSPDADFYAVDVRLLPAGATFDAGWLAEGTVLRRLADWPEVSPGSVQTQPSYGPLPDGSGVLRDDGSWVAPLWVPYGTPVGSYTVRARCSIYFPEGEGYDVRRVDSAPASFAVTAWPAFPPTYTPCAVPRGALVDGTGTIHRWGWEPRPGDLVLTGDAGWWPGRDLARGVDFDYHPLTGGGGLVVDAHGGLHRFRDPYVGGGLAEPHSAAYWPGRDIARGVAITDGWGVVLDAWGGLHPFTLGTGPAITVTAGTAAYWPGWDIARDLALLPSGRGGYVLDAWGGLHPFGLHGMPAPRKPLWQPYWPGWDIARGVVLLDDRSGYIFDAWGGVHPFSVDGAYLPARPPTPYWPGRDVVRGAVVIGC